MNITHHPKGILTAALLSGGVAVAALATGNAQADTGLAPQIHSPYATDNFSQPH